VKFEVAAMRDIVCVIALIYNNMARNEMEFDYAIVIRQFGDSALQLETNANAHAVPAVSACAS